MIEIENGIKELSYIENRHNNFKNIFLKFKKNIMYLGSDRSPVKGMVIKSECDNVAQICFIDRKYELRFSSDKVDGKIKGKISAKRILDDNSCIDLNDITYDGESKIEGRAGMLINDTECIKLVFNWLLEEIQDR